MYDFAAYGERYPKMHLKFLGFIFSEKKLSHYDG